MPSIASRIKKPRLPKAPALPLMHRGPKVPLMPTTPEERAFAEATTKLIQELEPELRHRIREALKYVQPGRTKATMPELIEFGELLSRDMQPGLSFSFQSSLEGGRIELGGAVVDFLIEDREPRLAIRIQGREFHTGVYLEAKDLDQQIMLEAQNIEVHDVWEEQTYSLHQLVEANNEILGFAISGPIKAQLDRESS